MKRQGSYGVGIHCGFGGCRCFRLKMFHLPTCVIQYVERS